MDARPKAVVRLSGGVDSTTAAALGRRRRLRAPRSDVRLRAASRRRDRGGAAGGAGARCRPPRGAEDRPPCVRWLGAHRGHRGVEGPRAGDDGARHPRHLRAGPSSASTSTTLRATPTAGRSSSRRSSGWRRWPLAPASRAAEAGVPDPTLYQE